MTIWNAMFDRTRQPAAKAPDTPDSAMQQTQSSRRWLSPALVIAFSLAAVGTGGYVLADDKFSFKEPAQDGAPSAGAASAPDSAKGDAPSTAGSQVQGSGGSAAAPDGPKDAGRLAESARSAGLLEPGQLIVSGFSGTFRAGRSFKTSVGAPADKNVFINLDGAVLRVFDVAGVRTNNVGARQGAVEVLSLSARQIGQVFGIALDDTTAESGKLISNIYVAATAAYGLHIVVPKKDGTARRVVGGRPGATFMEGLFGSDQAGPGTIWRIDGVTGEVTPFANITHNDQPNSGPGVGNLTFDPVSRQLFASDHDTGHIHRFSMSGKNLGSFDHGVTARKRAGLEIITDDPTDRAYITTKAFSADDPSTWGFSHPSRRVWGLAVFGRRLYYAVAAGPEIWSVAINADGSFGDTQRELQLPNDIEPFEIADIAFSSRGEMILAQRPPVTGAQDYVTLIAPGPARVLRYRLDEKSSDTNAPRWLPTAEEYAVGKKAEYRFTAGSVALGYAHKPEGGLDYSKCDAMLWTTGDGLSQASQLPEARVAQARHDSLSSGLSGVIDGLQGIGVDFVRSEAEPPKGARFFDFDGVYLDQGSRGQVGAVRILQNCGSVAAGQTTKPMAWWKPSFGKDPNVGRGYDLKLTKKAIGSCVQGGSICRFRVTFENKGPRTFVGPLLLRDRLVQPGAILVGSNPSPWVCTQAGAFSSCHRPTVLMKPGRKISLTLSFKLPAGWPSKRFRNCARINWLSTTTSGHRVRTVAFELSRLGYYAGPSTNILTPGLTQAILDYQADKSLTETGQVNAALLDALFGAGAGHGRDNDPSNDRDCATHHLASVIAAPMKLLSPNLILPALPPPLPISKPGPKRCKWGKIRRHGKCVRVCSPGYTLTSGRCRPVCWGGKYFNGSSCVCPRRKVFNPIVNACVRRGRVCPVGMKNSGGACVCRRGKTWSWRKQACVSVWRPCPAFFTRRSGICVPIINIGHCPLGYRKRRGKCVSIIPGKFCPPGHLRRNGRCIFVFNPKPCPFGQVRRNGKCKLTIAIGGNKCPLGLVRRGGRCKLPGKIGWCPPGLIKTSKGCKSAVVRIKGKFQLKRPLLHRLQPKTKNRPKFKLLPKRKVLPKLKVFPKAKVTPKLRVLPRRNILPKVKITPKLKVRPKRRIAPKVKLVPKLKIKPKSRIVPKVKLTPKRRVAPKIKLAPKKRVAPKLRIVPRKRVTPKRRIIPKKRVAPKRRIIPQVKIRRAPKVRFKAKPAVRKRVKRRTVVRRPVVKRKKIRRATVKRAPARRIKAVRKNPPRKTVKKKKVFQIQQKKVQRRKH